MTGAVMAASALAGGIKVTVAPNPVVGVGTQTGIATATVDNAVLPVSYSWVFQGGDSLSPQSPTSQGTRFVGSPPGGEIFFASYVCVVIDATGATATSDVLVARLTG